MQYGHWVVSATATAISSLYLSGITPPLNAASSNATNALNASGASSPNFFNFAIFFMSYIEHSSKETHPISSMPIATVDGTGFSTRFLTTLLNRLQVSAVDWSAILAGGFSDWSCRALARQSKCGIAIGRRSKKGALAMLSEALVNLFADGIYGLLVGVVMTFHAKAP